MGTLLELLRNLTRRKLRNGLTIGGIAIGVLALSTLGALAEKNNKLLEGGIQYFSDHVSVSDSSANGFGGGGLLKLSLLDQVKQVDGVAAAFPSAGAAAQGDGPGFSTGVPPEIVSTEPGAFAYEKFKLTAKLGRGPETLADGEVVLGADIAKVVGKGLGDTVALPVPPKVARADFINHQFRVVGILDKTLTAPDNFAYVTLHDGQRALGDSLPPALRGQVDATQLVGGIDVYGKPGVNLDDLAGRINKQVPGLKAIPPSEVVKAFQSFSAIFSAITTGSALLALIVGGLSVINTMLMSVTERYREIGLKKAIGARTRHILTEYVAEAIAIGMVGGAIGLSLGWLTTTVIN
ncbi:MAG TPA: ABC transporter permease, partial [Candidatus Dormibacteraeota bacterium]|nr:ABC transporter permease [Candidatus Dormibacteraeota bacterium]